LGIKKEEELLSFVKYIKTVDGGNTMKAWDLRGRTLTRVQFSKFISSKNAFRQKGEEGVFKKFPGGLTG